MNIYLAAKEYVRKAINLSGSGMKVLMVDEETLKTVSLVFSMSHIMEESVYLIQRIDMPRDKLGYLKCICFVRPTPDNIERLSQELRKPNYAAYYVFFSHSLTKQLLKQLAEADEHELVVSVQEHFADYMPLSPFLFELNIRKSFEQNRSVSSRVLSRMTDGLTAVCLALQKCPIIRYQNASEAARHLAESVRSLISREAVLFDFKSYNPAPVLLILDRRQDCVTPLLTQWTYEAMVHELLGISFNRVNLRRAPNVRQGLEEVILNREFDEFFRVNQHAIFGDIGQAIKRLVEDFQMASKSVDVKNLESIGDLKKLLENYPAFRKASGTVETHVTLVSELSRIVKEHGLLDVSEAEQYLVCHDNHSASLSRIRSLVNDPRITLSDALRLTLLYALRYENQEKEIDELTKTLRSRGATEEDVSLIGKLLDFSWSKSRSDGLDLFSVVKNATTGSTVADSQMASNAFSSFKKRIVKGLKGVENVYTQHQPLLFDILNDLIKGQLKETSFPSLTTSAHHKITANSRPTQIIVFFIGGATYEEAHFVHKLNSTTPNLDIILGSTCVHNSRSFLEEVASFAKGTTSYGDSSHISDPRANRPTRRAFGLSRSNIRYGLLQ